MTDGQRTDVTGTDVTGTDAQNSDADERSERIEERRRARFELEFGKRTDFDDPKKEWRRLFSGLLGTFLLVLAGAGGAVVGAQSGGLIGRAAAVTAPGLTVMAIILFMGAVSGAHLNPAVTLAFAARGDFPWRRVPGYIIVQLVGATVACLVLWAILGKLGALGVGGYIILAGLWSSPISGGSMNPARSFGPDLALWDFSHYWVYIGGPLAGAALAVGCAWILRGAGGGRSGSAAAQGRIGSPETTRDQQ